MGCDVGRMATSPLRSGYSLTTYGFIINYKGGGVVVSNCSRSAGLKATSVVCAVPHCPRPGCCSCSPPGSRSAGVYEQTGWQKFATKGYTSANPLPMPGRVTIQYALKYSKRDVNHRRPAIKEKQANSNPQINEIKQLDKEKTFVRAQL